MQEKNAGNSGLYTAAGIAALLAMGANILDVVLGMGTAEVVAFGSRSAADWFAVFGENGFRGLYELGILNIVYMTLMAPLFLALWTAHARRCGPLATLAAIAFLVGMASYVAVNAAVPMAVLAGKYAAGSEAARTVLLAAGEAVLARGEDFTPGSFVPLFIGGCGSILGAVVQLRGGIFGKANAWIGIIGFSFLQTFTVLATFVPSAYLVAFYFFGMVGGLLALAWFFLTARQFFALARSGSPQD